MGAVGLLGGRGLLLGEMEFGCKFGGRELGAGDIIVSGAGSEEIKVATATDDLTFVENDDLLGVFDGVDALSNNDIGDIFEMRAEFLA